jgi:hypothetical protein
VLLHQITTVQQCTELQGTFANYSQIGYTDFLAKMLRWLMHVHDDDDDDDDDDDGGGGGGGGGDAISWSSG